MAEQLIRGMPHAQGIPAAAVTRLVRAWQSKELHIHSLMLVRHGAVVAEGWWAPYRREFTHTLNSLSKSFTSTAVGFAVQEKRLTVEDRVLDYFPGRVRHPCENMKKMKIKHLLSMSTGQIPDTSDTFEFEDQVTAFLASDVPCEPGSRFAYNTGATYMLSAIVQQVTGLSVFDYLQPRLFGPLGIENIRWEHCAKGISLGGVGLNLKTEDIAKFGLFLLNRGAYGGRQLLDPAWIDAATAFHIPTEESTESPWLDSPDPAARPAKGPVTDWTAGYGYQFWRCAPDGVYRGDGAFGQFCLVMPRQDAVLAVTAGGDDLQSILSQVWNILLPAMGEGPLPFDAAGQAEMEQLLQNLTVSPAAGAASDQVPEAAKRQGQVYQVARNPMGISRVRFDFLSHPGRDALHLTVHGREYTIECGRSRWADNDLGFEPDHVFPFHRMAQPELSASAAWQAGEGHYRVEIVYNHASYAHTADLHFHGDSFTAELRQNLAAEEPLPLHGVALAQ